MKRRGISLIVLVVTIIVIIILAGAVILSLTQNNPIEEANEATFKSNVGEYTSEITLYVAKQYSASNGSFDMKNLNVQAKNIKTVITSMKGADEGKFEIQKSELVYIKEKCSTNEITWLADMGIKEKDSAVIPPVATIPAPPNGSVFIDKDGKNAPIPEGFAIDTNNSVVNDGLVIKDGDGNEFVWIPTGDITGGFKRRILRNEEFSLDRFHEDYPLDSGEYKEITDSEAKYKGFYIARYEAGLPAGGSTSVINGSQKPVSKKGATVWNNIRFAADRTDVTGVTDGALKVAKSMYNTENVKSTLVYPAHFDTIMQWMLDAPTGTLKNGTGLVLDNTTAYSGSHIDAAGTPSNEILQNSSRWGNYLSSSKYQGVAVLTATEILQTAGSSESYRVKNIYDLAGNIFEWNMEAYATYGRVLCSGSYSESGVYYPVSFSGDNHPYSIKEHYGFRPVLYIK